MRIYSSTAIDPRLSEMCENALAAEAFMPQGAMPDGGHIISFEVEGRTYVGIIGVEKTEGDDDALLISAVYPVGSEGLPAIISDLQTGT